MSNEKTELPQEIKVNLIQGDHTDDGVSIAALLQSFGRRKLMVLAVTMISFIVGIVAAFGYGLATKADSGSASAILSYNYKGVEQGVDPKGRPLDVSKVKSPYVLDQALQELDLYSSDVTVEAVRSNIEIEEILPSDVMERILVIKEIAAKEPSKLEALVDMEYYPTQFRITLIRRNAIEKLSNTQMTQLLNTVLEKYVSYFIEEYSDRYAFETLTGDFNQENYDYPEVIEVLNSQINNMISYCEAKRHASPDFKSPTTQMTFGDIITNLELIQSVDVNRVSALVFSTQMSRDKEKMIKMYEYRVLRLARDRDVAIENAQAARSMAASYQKDVSMIMGTMGEATTLTQASAVYDNFVEEALTQTKKANSLNEEIAFYQTRLAALGASGQVGEEDFDPLPEASAADISFVEESIPSILDSLQNWADITNQTNDDYLTLEVFKDATKVVIPATFDQSRFESVKTMMIIIAVVTFVGFFLASLAAIWKLAFSVAE